MKVYNFLILLKIQLLKADISIQYMNVYDILIKRKTRILLNKFDHIKFSRTDSSGISFVLKIHTKCKFMFCYFDAGKLNCSEKFLYFQKDPPPQFIFSFFLTHNT